MAAATFGGAVRRLPAILLVLSACAPPERAWLQIPAADSDRAAVVAVVSDRRTVLEAIDLDAGPRLELALDAQETGRIEWLAYEVELDRLGLEPGPLEPAAEGAPATRIPDPRAAFHSTFDGATTSAWAGGAVSDLLRTFRVASIDRCRELSATALRVDATDGVRLTVAVSDDAAVFATKDARAYRYSSAGLETISMTPPVEVAGSFVDERGDLWAFGSYGDVYRARYDGAGLVLTEHSRLPAEHAIRWADGGPLDGGAYELFVLTADGFVYRYDGATWTQIDERGEATKGGLVRLGPDEAIFATGTDARLFHYSAGAVTPVDVGNGGFTMLERAEARGIYFAFGQGNLFRYVRGTIETVGQSAIHLDVYTILATPTGFVYGGAVGLMGEYVDGVGFCPATQPAGTSIRAIVPLRGGYLLTGDRSDDEGKPQATFVSASAR